MSRLTALVLVAAFAGCDEADTTDDTRTDQERIVGTWTAVTASVNVQGLPFGIPVADLTRTDDEQTVAFRADGTYTLRFDPADGRTVTISYAGRDYVTFPLTQTVTLAGTYTVEDATDTVVLKTVSGQASDLRLGYAFGAFSSSDSVALTARDSGTLARLFGIASDDAARVAQVVTGGSITYAEGI